MIKKTIWEGKMKITFLGAGSTIFVKNVIGDTLLCDSLSDCEVALYDIDPARLAESKLVVDGLNKRYNGGKARISTYLGVENRKDALRGASFVINAVQVGLYDPCTILDFEIPKKYGLRQTIGDTLGIGGIFRGLRTIHVMRGFAEDIEEVCPDALLLNYTNPMAIISGYMQRYTGVKTVGLCHSVQVCVPRLLDMLGIPDRKVTSSLIAGINHMAWLLDIRGEGGVDLYPEIKKLAKEKNATEKHKDMVRFDYIDKLGYYCTESSEHNAEYNPFYIKSKYPELIERFNIPLDEYPRRCIKQIGEWGAQRDALLSGKDLEHNRSSEYASRIMEAMVTDVPTQIGGNVINNGCITNLPKEACVEVPCLVNRLGIQPTVVGALPIQCAAMNMTNINVQLLTIEAAVTRKKDAIYQAAMMDPHTASELSIDDIVRLCDDLIEAHKGWLPEYH